MSDEQDIGPQKRPASLNQIVAQQKSVAKELYSSSPLESVVQGRPESPAPLNPDRSGDATLSELRARASNAREEALAEMAKYPAKTIFHYGQYCGAFAYREMLQWLDELAQPSNNTALDTKSSSDGVP